MFLAFIDNRI